MARSLCIAVRLGRSTASCSSEWRLGSGGHAVVCRNSDTGRSATTRQVTGAIGQVSASCPSADVSGAVAAVGRTGSARGMLVAARTRRHSVAGSASPARRSATLSLLRAKPPKGGDAESRGYRGFTPAIARRAASEASLAAVLSSGPSQRGRSHRSIKGVYMRTTFYLAAALGAVLCGTAVVAAQTGNGAPSGSHFNLNIIGVSNSKNQNMDGNGNVIFVALGSSDTKATTKILLSPGDFAVLDKNGAFFFSSRRRHTRWPRDWSSDVCSSDLV